MRTLIQLILIAAVVWELLAAALPADALEIPSAPSLRAVGFVNARDLEALDGQLFVVDSRLPSATESTQLDGSVVSGRLLRVCP